MGNFQVIKIEIKFWREKQIKFFGQILLVRSLVRKI